MQEWPEEVYPNYANGPGYIVSSDIARYIVSEFDSQTLRVRISSFAADWHEFSIQTSKIAECLCPFWCAAV